MSLRRADHSSRRILPTVVCRCVWSWNLVNEVALAHWGLVRPPPPTKDGVTACGVFCVSVLGFSTAFQTLTRGIVTYWTNRSLLKLAYSEDKERSLYACSCCDTFSANKTHWLKYSKTDHKIRFTLGLNSYMFRHQGAIFREFINNKRP
jgi:hypothetical protein